jgi:hypothetical protein
MTDLTKPVRRVVLQATVYEAGAERPVVATLHPNGTVGFRTKGCKREYCLPISKCYVMAVDAHVKDEKRKKAAEKKKKKRRR